VDLSVLQRAVFSDVRLSLRYRHGRDVQVRSYTVHPYGLVNKAGAWYLIADHRGEPKLFRVDRLLSATILEEPVRRRPGVELAEVWEKVRSVFENVPAEVRVIVDVQRSMLARILSVHGAELMTSLDDDFNDVLDGSGPVRLEFGFRSMGSAEQLLVFGEAIEVLEPTELREVLAEKARRTAALYD
jgi:predicted DNA-binding transcriptional regulator YafY